MFRAKIDVTLKKTVLDPQGKTVLSALHSLGFDQTSNVRVGKFFDLTIGVDSEKAAKEHVEQICNKLLVNPVIEEYSYSLEKV